MVGILSGTTSRRVAAAACISPLLPDMLLITALSALSMLQMAPSLAPTQATSHKKHLTTQLALSLGPSLSCSLDGHTKLFLRRFISQRDLPSGLTVSCLALTNIDVARNQRRQGHARRAMHALQLVAAESQQALIVENVCSPHMHAIVAAMDGKALWGNREGCRGCSYWVPPQPSVTWEDLAVSTTSLSKV